MKGMTKKHEAQKQQIGLLIRFYGWGPERKVKKGKREGEREVVEGGKPLMKRKNRAQ